MHARGGASFESLWVGGKVAWVRQDRFLYKHMYINLYIYLYRDDIQQLARTAYAVVVPFLNVCISHPGELES